MKVMKFGGSCLKEAKDFRRVTEIIREEKRPRIVVVSAIHGTTANIISHLSGRVTRRRGSSLPRWKEGPRSSKGSSMASAIQRSSQIGPGTWF